MKKVKPINKLEEMLSQSARSVIKNSDGYMSQDEVAEKAIASIDTSVFSIDDVIEDVARNSAKKAIDQVTASTGYDADGDTPQMRLIPDYDSYINHGLKYKGGVVLYKHATTKHLIHEMKNTNDNRAAVNIAADRKVELNSLLIEVISVDASIHTAGEAARILLDDHKITKKALK